jgi:hypothetical protein
MILKRPQWYYPVRFARPSDFNDTPQAWAKLERDYRKFLRELGEAVRCFGAEKVGRDLHEIIKGRQGNTPKEKRNARILAKYSALGNKSKAVRKYIEEHPEETFGADDAKKPFKKVYRQLGRLLKDEAKRERWRVRSERDFQEVLQRRGRSVVGSIDAASDSIPSETNKRHIKRRR